MDAMDAITTRCSVRKYTRQPVDDSLIEQVVDAGRLAATARNVQPWEFVVVTDPATRAKIAEATDYGKFIADAPVCIVVFCKDTKYYLEDGSAATQNLLVAARALGLATCWVAGDKKPYAPKIAEILGVPPEYKLIAHVPLGYAAEEGARAKKRPLAEVLHKERFGGR